MKEKIKKNEQKNPMRILVNNDFKYFLGKHIFPFMGFVFNLLTLAFFWDKSYFYFFHHNSYYVYKDLLKTNKSNIDLNDWRGHTIVLWHDRKMISIHESNGNSCVISSFYSSNWDKNMNHKIYNLFS